MVAGSLAAHTLGPTFLPATRASELTHREAGETIGLHAHASRGFAAHIVLWLGVLAAVLVVWALYRVLGRHRRGLGAGCFFLLPLVAYSAQELTERLLHAESFPFQAVFEPRFLLGLAAQLPFAGAAFALGWLVLRAGSRLVKFLNSPRLIQPGAIEARLRTPSARSVPGVPALSRGHPLRGPPLLA